MTSIYTCPACGGAFNTRQLLAAGGMCPDCRRLLERVPNGSGDAPAPDFAAPAPQHPEEVWQAAHRSAAPAEPALREWNGDRVHLRDAAAAQPDDSVALLVSPVKGRRGESTPGRAAREIPAITQLLNALGQVQPLCLEICGLAERRFLVMRCRRADAALVRSQLTGLYGTPEIRELPPEMDPARLFDEPGISSATARLGLALPAGLPLRGYDELLENDTLLPILGALVDAGEGEAGLAQVLVHGPADRRWASSYREELLLVRRGMAAALTPRQIWKWTLLCLGAGLLAFYAVFELWLALLCLIGMGTTVAWMTRSFFAGSGLAWRDALEEQVERKIRQNGCRAEVRLAAAAASPERAAALLSALEGAYQVFNAESGNRLARIRPDAPFLPHHLAAYKPGIQILGDEEIASLWHLPVGGIPDRLHAVRVDAVLPDPGRLARSPEQSWRLGVMGKSAGGEMPVYLPRAAITRTHALFMGKTRTGKTTGLENAIRELAAEPGRAIVAVDPHDDMVTDLLGLIPPERAGDVIYLNFADPGFAPALNLLDVNLFGGDPERTAEALSEVARAIFKKYWGPRMDVVFERMALSLALANTIRAADQQYTILDGLALLNMNKESRQAFLERVLPPGHVQTAVLTNYFQTEFENLSHSMREQVIMPVLSKLRPFESNTHLLAAFGQPASSVDPMAAVRDGKILLVRTGATVLSHDYSNFIGSLFLNLVRRAIFAQADLPPARRTPVTVIVDESQSFTGLDYGAALAQLAKFGGNLILTTQGADFIGRSTASDEADDPHAFAKILSNVDTLLVYRVSGEDAVSLAETEFVGELTAPDLIYLPDYQAFVRFKRGGELVGPFRVTMDPPPPRDERVAAQIRDAQHRYCRPLPEALAAAGLAGRRLQAYFGTRRAAQTSAQDGEMSLPPGPGAPDAPAAAPARRSLSPTGQPPGEVDRAVAAILQEDFVYLGSRPERMEADDPPPPATEPDDEAQVDE